MQTLDLTQFAAQQAQAQSLTEALGLEDIDNNRTYNGDSNLCRGILYLSACCDQITNIFVNNKL